jgi:hypothetical protein
MNKARFGILALALAITATSACKGSGAAGGGQTGDTGGTGGSGAGGSGTSTGSGGAGGSAASGTGGRSSSMGGAGGSSGTSGGASAAPVTCGTATCTGSGFFRGCCVDAAKSTCGVESSLVGVKCGVPAVLDPLCPDHAAIMNMTAKGCCTQSHICGYSLSGSPCMLATVDGGTMKACGMDTDAGM